MHARGPNLGTSRTAHKRRDILDLCAFNQVPAKRRKTSISYDTSSSSVGEDVALLKRSTNQVSRQSCDDSRNVIVDFAASGDAQSSCVRTNACNDNMQVLISQDAPT